MTAILFLVGVFVVLPGLVFWAIVKFGRCEPGCTEGRHDENWRPIRNDDESHGQWVWWRDGEGFAG